MPDDLAAPGFAPVEPTGGWTITSRDVADRPPHRDARGARPVAPRTGRREPRYLAAWDRLWMQWWCDGEFNGLSARLVNVSRHGALIVSAARLRQGQPVRLFLEEGPPEVRVDANVLGVVEGGAGLHQVRLGFQSPCPDAFLEAAALGFEAWLAGQRLRV
jgi:hypothetical protein